MKLNDVLVILQNYLIKLEETRKLAVSAGNLEQVSKLDNSIGETIISINQLKIDLNL